MSRTTRSQRGEGSQALPCALGRWCLVNHGSQTLRAGHHKCSGKVLREREAAQAMGSCEYCEGKHVHNLCAQAVHLPELVFACEKQVEMYHRRSNKALSVALSEPTQGRTSQFPLLSITTTLDSDNDSLGELDGSSVQFDNEDVAVRTADAKTEWASALLMQGHKFIATLLDGPLVENIPDKPEDSIKLLVEYIQQNTVAKTGRKFGAALEKVLAMNEKKTLVYQRLRAFLVEIFQQTSLESLAGSISSQTSSNPDATFASDLKVALDASSGVPLSAEHFPFFLPGNARKLVCKPVEANAVARNVTMALFCICPALLKVEDNAFVPAFKPDDTCEGNLLDAFFQSARAFSYGLLKGHRNATIVAPGGVAAGITANPSANKSWQGVEIANICARFGEVIAAPEHSLIVQNILGGTETLEAMNAAGGRDAPIPNKVEAWERLAGVINGTLSVSGFDTADAASEGPGSRFTRFEAQNRFPSYCPSLHPEEVPRNQYVVKPSDLQYLRGRIKRSIVKALSDIGRSGRCDPEEALHGASSSTDHDDFMGESTRSQIDAATTPSSSGSSRLQIRIPPSQEPSSASQSSAPSRTAHEADSSVVDLDGTVLDTLRRDARLARIHWEGPLYILLLTQYGDLNAKTLVSGFFGAGTRETLLKSSDLNRTRRSRTTGTYDGVIEVIRENGNTQNRLRLDMERHESMRREQTQNAMLKTLEWKREKFGYEKELALLRLEIDRKDAATRELEAIARHFEFAATHSDTSNKRKLQLLDMHQNAVLKRFLKEME